MWTRWRIYWNGEWVQTSIFLFFALLDQVPFKTHESLSEPILLQHAFSTFGIPGTMSKIMPKLIGNTAHLSHPRFQKGKLPFQLASNKYTVWNAAPTFLKFGFFIWKRNVGNFIYTDRKGWLVYNKPPVYIALMFSVFLDASNIFYLCFAAHLNPPFIFTLMGLFMSPFNGLTHIELKYHLPFC